MISRRRFLQRLSWSGGLLAVARLGPGAARAATPESTRADGGLQVLTERQAEILTAIVERMVDSADAGLPRVRDTRALFTIDQALLWLDAEQRSQFLWLLPVFHWGAVLYRGRLRPFLRLSAVEQDEYLQAWAKSRFATCRLAFRALKNLSMLGYYSQDETWAAIHYGGPWVKRPRRIWRPTAAAE